MIYVLLTHSSFKFGVTGGCRSLSDPVSITIFFSFFFHLSYLFDRRAITGAICKRRVRDLDKTQMAQKKFVQSLGSVGMGNGHNIHFDEICIYAF